MRGGEAELVRRAQAGDRDAFGRLAERHQRALFRFLLGLVTDHHAAEELTQETLLRAFQRIRDLQDPERLRPWLVAIARNLARRWLRRHRRRPVRSLDPETPAPAGNPDPSVRATEVMDALARLKPAEREVLVLFEMEGLSHAQIAAITGASESALRTRLMRARRRLREMLNDAD